MFCVSQLALSAPIGAFKCLTTLGVFWGSSLPVHAFEIGNRRFGPPTEDLKMKAGVCERICRGGLLESFEQYPALTFFRGHIEELEETRTVQSSWWKKASRPTEGGQRKKEHKISPRDTVDAYFA
jgi:hypothetical protein